LTDAAALRRQSNRRLTATGKKLFEKTAPVMKAHRDSLFVGVSKTDKKVLLMVFDQLERNMGGDGSGSR
jgi:DNA-binding MarR family transcriptional regulator